MKRWYQSKAMWAGLGLCILGGIHYYRTGDYMQTAEIILTGFGIMGIRSGWKKIS